VVNLYLSLTDHLGN